MPVLKKHSLQFVRYSWGDELINNSFNIAEPLTTEKLPPKLLSTILIPLVGFDREGHRLGMGGGYYDRTLNFMLQKSCQKKPLLIGVGYSLQKVNHIQAQPWDVPLDAIVTECGLACFSTKAQSLLHGF
ncbi:MAG: 5-formyltetrahydrofolate cyclo-ligase [Cycloclasticus sp. symbiont of Bathymodiolus heckerae]|nr:MAG: 5-formyltetrahydrofolate cyclo-ligase [Cycloclasticus sp. symbiont of Bathymodiolus heckerae]